MRLALLLFASSLLTTASSALAAASSQASGDPLVARCEWFPAGKLGTSKPGPDGLWHLRGVLRRDAKRVFVEQDGFRAVTDCEQLLGAHVGQEVSLAAKFAPGDGTVGSFSLRSSDGALIAAASDLYLHDVVLDPIKAAVAPLQSASQTVSSNPCFQKQTTMAAVLTAPGAKPLELAPGTNRRVGGYLVQLGDCGERDGISCDHTPARICELRLVAVPAER